MDFRMGKILTAATLVLGLGGPVALADGHNRFTADHVFDLEYANNPQISPDGSTIVYERRSMDKLKDVNRSDLWVLDVESGRHRPLIDGGASAQAPVWSPDGTRLLYTTATEGRADLRLLYLDSGEDFSLAQFDQAPRQATWSPDGRQIAITMLVPEAPPSFATSPKPPEGAAWNAPVRVFDEMVFRFDGAGYLTRGDDQIFVIPAEGGTPRQVTDGGGGFTGPAWLDNNTLLVVGNDNEDRELDPIESDIYAVNLASGERTELTSRDGPDGNPKVSPNGRLIAFTGYSDDLKAYQQTELSIMEPDGSNARVITGDYDRSIGAFAWTADSDAIIAQVEDRGDIKLVRFDLDGDNEVVATGLGGTSFGRPYAGASFSISNQKRPTMAITMNPVNAPADVAVLRGSNERRRLTRLNDDLLAHLDMAPIEEITVPSSADGREIQAWVATPPGFKADGSYPLILEIHGGPFTMYAPVFSAEIQRYAAEGYVTVYVNPRGSTGYGEEFAQLIDNNYPSQDYHDLMSVVSHLVEQGYANPDRLFVTGGSGGGVLTSWIVGKTDRFAAAATVKPVINWLSMALSADIGMFVKRHWIRAEPWEDPMAYWEYSPLSLVGNVSTPTMVMVGEEDWRTPTWEAEQYYFALKQRQVPTALVRVPSSSHYIAGRPSRLIAKTDNIMGWFRKYDPANQ